MEDNRTQRHKKIRQQADEILAQSSEKLQERSAQDIRKLIHELDVYHTELEIQNEEMRRIQAELVDSRKRYFELFDLAPIAYFVFDQKSMIKETNFVGCNMLGVEKKFLLKSGFSRFVCPDFQSKFHEHCKRIFKSRQKEVCELKLKKGDGTEFFAQLESIAAQDDEGKFTLQQTTVTDIDLQKQALNALEEGKREIQELNSLLENRVTEEIEKNRQKDIIMMHQARLAAMGKMIGNIAHQWRQPLTALSMVLFNIKDLYEQDGLNDDMVDQLISTGTALTQKMSTTIDDFRGFFNPNKQKKAFCINKLVKESLSLLYPVSSAENIGIELNTTEEVSCFGYANEYSQVVMNILNNAKEAIIGKGIKHGKITIDIFKDNDYSVLKVQDNAGGVPENIKDSIFNPYFTTKENIKGTGLGLYLSKVIIEEHMKGRLELHNLADGAEFRICVPLVGINT